MAKVILTPIGTEQNKTENFKKYSKENEKLAAKIKKKRAEILQGWGKEYQERVKKKNKMTTWARVSLLADEPSKIHTLGTFVNDGLLFGEGKIKKSSPAAGVITAFVQIENRWVVVIANDNTVASGSWWPKTPEKIIRAQEIALKLKVPVVYLVDCSGLFLPEQAKSFPGQKGAGRIFKMNSELSNAGVPQIAGVMGDCIAGGGYMPIISDKVYMTEQAYMVIAGAALIQSAKSQNLSSKDIGGAKVHVHLSNCADFRVIDDEECLKSIRKEIRNLSSSAVDYYRNQSTPSSPTYKTQSLLGVVPVKTGQAYDVREVIARLLDDSLFKEFAPHTGHEVVVGVGKIAGLYVAIAANEQNLTPHPEKPESKRPGGILYREGVAKLAAFSRACESDGIPLIWLQDVSGFDVGYEAEKQGLLGFGSSLIYANSIRQSLMFTVLLRKASGAGYYAMAGLPYDPVVQLATPLSRLAVMEGKTLAYGAFNSRLDANFKIVAKNPKERAEVEAGMKKVSDRIEVDMDPLKAASQMDVDEVINLTEIRDYLVCLTEASYQTQGSRRIKNSRIWSLHDLDVLFKSSSMLLRKDELKQQPSSAKKTKENNKSKKGVRAPLEGMLYLRLEPNKPPFVSVGKKIKPQDTLGLIEVMKCFYPVKYEGTTQVEIKKIHIEDGEAVKEGQLIFEFC